MLEVTITQPGKDQVTLNVPETLAEMPLATYVGIVTEREMGEVIGENEMAIICRTVASAFDLPESEVLNLDANAVQSLYMMLIKPIQAYSPKLNSENIEIQHAGKTYTLPQCLTGVGAYVLTLGQHIQLEEAQRIAERSKIRMVEMHKQQPNAEAVQGYGNALFSEYCGMLAVLLLEKGEQLPTDARQRMDYIERQKFEFSTIKANVALDAAFFLSSSTTGYKDVVNFIISLTHRSISVIMTVTGMKNKTTKARPANTAKR